VQKEVVKRRGVDQTQNWLVRSRSKGVGGEFAGGRGKLVAKRGVVVRPKRRVWWGTVNEGKSSTFGEGGGGDVNSQKKKKKTRKLIMRKKREEEGLSQQQDTRLFRKKKWDEGCFASTKDSFMKKKKENQKKWDRPSEKRGAKRKGQVDHVEK